MASASNQPLPSLPRDVSDDSLVDAELSAIYSQSSVAQPVMDPEMTLPDDAQSLTSTDIKSDPILSSLARQQSVAKSTGGPPVAFKARPAPDMRGEGQGPRMTKAARLRQGKWEAGSAAAGGSGRARTVVSSEEGRERKEVNYDNTPGHKRQGLNIAVASLSTPTIAPRETKASRLRNGGQVNSEGKTDRAAMAAANKARDREENLRKRASIALPASLAAPTIAPRANKSSQLRQTGPTASSSSRPISALATTTSAANITKPVQEGPRVKAAHEEKTNRRQSMSALKSLNQPSIAPRGNKSSMLRAPGSSSDTPTNRSQGTPSALEPERPRMGRPSTSSGPSITSTGGVRPFGSKPPVKTSRPSTSNGMGDASPAFGPRPTKASLLRAGMGSAKVPTNRL